MKVASLRPWHQGSLERDLPYRRGGHGTPGQPRELLVQEVGSTTDAVELDSGWYAGEVAQGRRDIHGPHALNGVVPAYRFGVEH